MSNHMLPVFTERSYKKMLVKDLMTPGISCVDITADALVIAQQMKKNNIGAVPVCSDQGEILGIITDRDLVLRHIAGNAAVAGEIMTKKPVCTSPDMDSHTAGLLFSKYGIRRLPVLSGGRVVGILSLCDIARKPVFADEAGDILCAISKE